MKRIILSIALGLATAADVCAQEKVFCNPINLNYRFMINEPSRREAADPVILMYKDKYYLFASKSGGYWSSDDMVNWKFLTNDVLPWEDYAPAAVVMDSAVYFMGMDKRIYRSTDLEGGKWDIVKENMPIGNPGDPCLFLDEDGRLYLYSGLSNLLPLYGVEIDKKTFNPIGQQTECIPINKDDHGWERIGDYNDMNKKRRPWLEGSWVNKINGKYYFAHSIPGTQYKSYCDAIYTSDSPLGPWTEAAHNPYAYKPEGFICGGGHGATYQDKYGNYWHVNTMVISVKDKYERRIGIFPSHIDKDGVLACNTAFGDYPHQVVNKKFHAFNDYQPRWMLLSYNKPVTVSSTLEGHEAANATDEEIRTYWSATTGNQGEWLCVDLEGVKTIGGIQVNFAEEGSTMLGRSNEDYHHYLLEYSLDGKKWKTYADKRKVKANTHEYIELPKTIKARYIRVTNHHVPSGKFAVSGLRIFGKGSGKAPQAVTGITAVRNQTDSCQVSLKWAPSASATGYNIRYGIAPDKLYNTYQVMGKSELKINSLNRRQKDYYFAIDAFNENGFTQGTNIIK